MVDARMLRQEAAEARELCRLNIPSSTTRNTCQREGDQSVRMTLIAGPSRAKEPTWRNGFIVHLTAYQASKTG